MTWGKKRKCRAQTVLLKKYFFHCMVKKNALMVKGRSTDYALIPRERRLQSYSQDQKRWTWGPLETEFSFSRVKRRRELRQWLYDGERKHDRPRQNHTSTKRRLFGLKRGTTAWNTLK